MGTGCMRQCALGLEEGSIPGKEWAGRRGRRQCWKVRTEEANEISDLRELASRWGHNSKRTLPSLPGGKDLNYRVPRGLGLLRVTDVTE